MAKSLKTSRSTPTVSSLMPRDPPIYATTIPISDLAAPANFECCGKCRSENLFALSGFLPEAFEAIQRDMIRGNAGWLRGPDDLLMNISHPGLSRLRKETRHFTHRTRSDLQSQVWLAGSRGTPPNRLNLIGFSTAALRYSTDHLTTVR